MSSLVSGTLEVRDFDDTRDTPGSGRTVGHRPPEPEPEPEPVWWRRRAARYGFAADAAALASAVCCALFTAWATAMPDLLMVLSPLLVVALVLAGVAVRMGMDRRAAEDFAVWSLEAGHES